MQTPPKPKMPTDEDDARCLMVSERHRLLLDDAEGLAREYLIAKAGEEKARLFGLPDLSANPLASVCRQLSTPGLYGVEPSVYHGAEPDAVDRLLEQTRAAGLFSKLQRVQYLALGLGEYLIRLDVPSSVGRLTVRLVSPACVYAEGTADLPDVPVRIWELRCRWYEKEWKWAWDRYDISDPEKPSYSVIEADCNDADADLSRFYLDPAGALVGEAYPFRYADGRPFLPWVVYRAADTGCMWNYLDKRGATVGTLNTIALSTYANHAALGASGRSVLCVNVAPIGDVRAAGSDVSQTTRPRSVSLLPGTWVFSEQTRDGAQPLVQEIGPGQDLQVLSDYAAAYESNQSIRAGLNPADATRAHANPTSGAALSITNRGRREFARQVTPQFRRADLEAIGKIAALCRLAGVATLPESGWSIVYAEIPDGPEEAADERDQIAWEQDRSLLSPVDAYLRLHPGADREAAFRALAQVAADRRRIEQEAAAASGGGGATEASLNGAQIASLVQIAQAVAGGTLSPPQGVAMIRAAIPSISEEAAVAIAGSPIPALTAPPTPTPAPPAGA